MQLGSPPAAGDDVDELWKHVAELYKYVRALGNMRAVLPGGYQGKLEVHDTNSVLIGDQVPLK